MQITLCVIGGLFAWYWLEYKRSDLIWYLDFKDVDVEND